MIDITRGRVAAIVLALLAGTGAAQDLSQVEMKPTRLADGVYMLVGAGGNIGLSFGADGAFLIDDQFAPLADKIKAAVAELTDQPVRFVINTHWHGDHTGGNEAFGQAGAVIVAHDNIYHRLSTDQFNAFFDSNFPAQPRAALPVVTFTERVTLRLNGDHVHAIHVPHAHTDGDAIVYFENADVLHMGDLFFNEMYPFIDLDSGGGIHGVLAGINKGLALADEDTRVIPGHGPLTDRAGLQAYRDMLVTLRDRIEALKEDGKTLEEAIATKPGAEWDERLGGGFINPAQLTTFIYNSL